MPLDSAKELLLVEVVLFQKFGAKFWGGVGMSCTLRREVHHIPVGPHRVDMIARRSVPRNGISRLRARGNTCITGRCMSSDSLALVVGLIGRVVSRRPAPSATIRAARAHALIPSAGALAMAAKAASRVTEYQARSKPSISDVQEGQGLSQFGPNMNE